MKRASLSKNATMEEMIDHNISEKSSCKVRKICNPVNIWFEKLSDSIAAVSGVLIFIYMIWVVADILGRFVFSKPIACTVEVGKIVLAFSAFLTLAAVQTKQMHIRATMLKDFISFRLWCWLDVFAYATGLFLITISAWSIFPFAVDSFLIKEADITYNIPVYPSKIAFFLGYFLLSIGILISLIKAISKCISNDNS